MNSDNKTAMEPPQQQRRPQRPNQMSDELEDDFQQLTRSIPKSSHTIATSPVNSEPLGWEHDFSYPRTQPRPRTKIIYDLGTPEMNSQGR